MTQNANSPEYLQHTLDTLTALQALLEPLSKDSPRVLKACAELDCVASLLRHAAQRRPVDNAFSECDFIEDYPAEPAFDEAMLECWGA